MRPVVLNIGSINIDYTYHVPHFVRPGETLSSSTLSRGLGGKGANQSVALAKAGIPVAHIGRVSLTDKWAVDLMGSKGVNVEHISLVEADSGHSIIQVDQSGENAIVLFGGANQSFEKSFLESVIDKEGHVEYVLMQNECNLLHDTFEIAHSTGMKVVLNPAPMDEAILALPLNKLDTLVVNRIEAIALSGADSIDAVIRELSSLMPQTRIVITLGEEGAILIYQGQIIRASAPFIDVVDTTAAGDTFVGYFLASVIGGLTDKASLDRACEAASLAATRMGAFESIPDISEISTSSR